MCCNVLPADFLWKSLLCECVCLCVFHLVIMILKMSLSLKTLMSARCSLECAQTAVVWTPRARSAASVPRVSPWTVLDARVWVRELHGKENIHHISWWSSYFQQLSTYFTIRPRHTNRGDFVFNFTTNFSRYAQWAVLLEVARGWVWWATAGEISCGHVLLFGGCCVGYRLRGVSQTRHTWVQSHLPQRDRLCQQRRYSDRQAVLQGYFYLYFCLCSIRISVTQTQIHCRGGCISPRRSDLNAAKFSDSVQSIGTWSKNNAS